MIGPKLKEFKKKIRISEEVKGVIFQICLFFLGFWLMGVRFLFGTYPFGFALLGATKKHAPFVFAGCVVSAIFVMEYDPAYIVALIALFGMRIAGSFVKKAELKKTELGQKQNKGVLELLFCEDRELRVALCALCAFGLSVYRVIINGYVYYDIFVLFFFTVLAGILCFCLCGLFEYRAKGQDFLLGISALAFCAVYALSGKEIGTIDIALLLSCAVVLYTSKIFSGGAGAVVGLVLGMAQSGTLIGVFGISGLISGLLWNVSSYLSVMCSFILGMGYAIYLEGYEAIVNYMPELLASSLVMYPLLRFEILPKPYMLIKKEKKSIEEYCVKSREKETKNKIDKLSLALKDVSKMLKDVSQRTKSPDKRGYADISLVTCEGYCYSCPKEMICWEREIKTTEENINKMGMAVYTRGEVNKGDVDERFLHRCPNIEKIMWDLNKKTRDMVKDGVKNDKLDISAQNYDTIGKMLSNLFLPDKEPALDKAMTDKAIRACATCGLVFDSVQVIGTRKKEIIASGVDIQRSKCTSEQLKKELERALEIGLGEVLVKEDGEENEIKIEMKNSIEADAYFDTVTKEQGEDNGDSECFFKTEGGYQYAILCDGMGSGRDAHVTSKMCTELLEKILSVSEEKEIALTMLNGFIRSKNTECSSTVDLLEIDLISREGRFVKSGAAPSFVIRGDNVFKLQSKTAPIGIMKGLDAEQLSFTLNKGDVCVMVSDGVVSSKQDGAWLTQFLKDTKPTDIKKLPKMIIAEAKKRGVNKDDATAIAVVIN